jgi:hypothetical protein
LIEVSVVDADLFGLAFDDQSGAGLGHGVGVGFPDHDVRAGAAVAVLGTAFLIHLRQAVAISLDQAADELLPDDFLGLGADVAPFLLERNPQPVALSVQLIRFRWERGRGCGLGSGHRCPLVSARQR